MKERPVIFNGEMVRAILDGRKTQTRRVMAAQPESNQFGLLRISDSTKRSDIGKYHWAESNATGTHQRSALFSCQFGQVGDRLWVRETFMDLTGTGIEATTGKFEGFAYRADTPAGSYGDEVRKEYGLKWTPSLHMPRKACRILLEITAVRVERLNDISEEDAKAEGVKPAGDMLPDYPDTFLTPKGDFATAKVAFQRLWQSIYGEESWRANPWVWVIEFRRVGGA
ncbi:morphogenetic protein [Serratia ureilytica]|uniref:morphogenetic protein n=1 Tax=Serratia ureilytica TaxID=300181 RepID=UPI001920377E|nr:morphogenetic protein [Serratia ureilytica]MBL0881237.1 morphogenetic protein [Serratia ureilytica]MDN2473503.1 morphogenetic protein [Serratia ureilytica]